MGRDLRWQEIASYRVNRYILDGMFFEGNYQRDLVGSFEFMGIHRSLWQNQNGLIDGPVFVRTLEILSFLGLALRPCMSRSVLTMNPRLLCFQTPWPLTSVLQLKGNVKNLGFPKVGSSCLYFWMQESLLSATFGIGTFLTNDFRSLSNGEKSKPLNIVIKLSSVNNQPCIKLSDDVTKVHIALVNVSYRTQTFPSDYWG